MRMKFMLFLSILFFSFPVPVKAQYYYEHRYGVDNGLLSMEIEQLYCSKKGEIWVTYSIIPFISKFDGLNWIHFDLLKMQLPQKLMVRDESESGIWFSGPTDHAEIVRFDSNEKWHRFTFDRSFKFTFDLHTKDPIILDPHYIPYYFNPSNKSFEKHPTPIYEPTADDKFEQLGITSTNHNLILHFHEPEKQEIRVQYGQKFASSMRYKSHYHIGILEVGESFWFLTIQNGEIGVLKNGKFEPVVLQSPNQSPLKTIKSIYHIYSGSNPGLQKQFYFVCQTIDDNQTHIYNTDIYGNSKIVLKNAPSDIGRHIAFDHFGRMWITTSTGISRIDTSQLSFQESNPKMVRSLHTLAEDSDSIIWMGGYHGTFAFSTFDGKKLESQSFTGAENFMSVLPGTYRDASGNIYNFGEKTGGLFGIKDKKIIPVTVKDRNEKLYGYIFHPLKNGFVGLGLAGLGLGIARLDNFCIDSLQLIGQNEGLRLINVLAIAQDKNDRIWMGRTSQGIAVYDPRTDTVYNWLREDDPEKGIGATCLNIDENNTLWMGTQKGLYYIHEIHQFDIRNENLFDCAKEIVLPGDPLSTPGFLLNDTKYFIVGTTMAVHFIDKTYKGERPRIFSLRFGKDLEGSGSEQNAVMKDSKGYLWVGAQTGATRLDLNNLPFDTSSTQIDLEYFRAGGIDIPFFENKVSKIPSKIRNLQISIRGSGNPLLHNNLVFDIILLRSRGDTIFSKINTTDLSFDLEYLPADKYDLHVVAYKNNVESASVSYAFTIPTLISESHWFWIIIVLLVMSIPALWISGSFRHKKSLLKQEIRLEQSRRERDELKILALANFFNPHFINNSLHWIQSKYRKDPDTALIIQRLAENVNILFHNSNKGKAYHNLGSEIELVKNYLGIQQIRFNQEFNISIETPDDSDSWQQVNIPSMLLQIHTENAIEKGIRQRKDANFFNLVIHDFNDHLEIYMQDDGVGRQIEDQDKVKLSRKGSTRIMQDLIDVLNQYNKDKIEISIKDHIFRGNNGITYGTGIHIILPKIFKYDIS